MVATTTVVVTSVSASASRRVNLSPPARSSLKHESISKDLLLLGDQALCLALANDTPTTVEHSGNNHHNFSIEAQSAQTGAAEGDEQASKQKSSAERPGCLKSDVGIVPFESDLTTAVHIQVSKCRPSSTNLRRSVAGGYNLVANLCRNNKLLLPASEFNDCRKNHQLTAIQSQQNRDFQNLTIHDKRDKRSNSDVATVTTCFNDEGRKETKAAAAETIAPQFRVRNGSFATSRFSLTTEKSEASGVNNNQCNNDDLSYTILLESSGVNCNEAGCIILIYRGQCGRSLKLPLQGVYKEIASSVMPPSYQRLVFPCGCCYAGVPRK